MEQQRNQLVPHVTRWKAYEARASVFQMRKLDFVQQQADLLACSVTATSLEVTALLFDIHMCLTTDLHLTEICCSSRALLALIVCM